MRAALLSPPQALLSPGPGNAVVRLGLVVAVIFLLASAVAALYVLVIGILRLSVLALR